MRLALLQNSLLQLELLVSLLLQIFFQPFQPLINLLQVGKNQLQLQIRHISQRINRSLRMRHAGIVKNPNHMRNRINLAE